MPVPASVDVYLDKQPPAFRKALENLRQAIRFAAPEAEEKISYQIPSFRYHGMLVFYGGWKNHCSLYVPRLASLQLEKELKNFKVNNATIQFTIDKPLPATLIRKIIKGAVKLNLEKEEMRSRRKVGKKVGTL
jgi:uncharacterized protein YdhG (YjbR/CyaY superfamily)